MTRFRIICRLIVNQLSSRFRFCIQTLGLILVLWSFVGCNTYHNGFIEYKIPKGRHYSKGWRWGITSNPYRHITFQLDSTCLKNIQQGTDAWSKVSGFTVFHTHWNSCRVGWRVMNEKIQLGYYCYVGHKRIAGVLTETEPNAINQAECFWDKKTREYVVRINGHEKRISQPRGSLFYLYTYPFVGGRYRANHEMKIWVKNHNPEAESLVRKIF